MKYIFSDFDGTLTWNEELGPIFFDILQEAKRLNSELIIVTGRSLSWGHFFLTHFPFKVCIVEGGGAILRKVGHRVVEELLIKDTEVQKLSQITDAMLKQHTDIELAYDSFGRKTDRAIDLLTLTDEQKKTVKESLTLLGANHSQSNVHINYWCGDFSKFKAVKSFLESVGCDQSEGVYFGDSMNDESMFKDFEHSVGVSNVAKILDRLKSKPKIILKGDLNKGPWGVLNYLRDL